MAVPAVVAAPATTAAHARPPATWPMPSATTITAATAPRPPSPSSGQRAPRRPCRP
ncbi:MAG TPA: hypothetical protein VGI96_23265 [Streptosporangiaceae bacterium]